MEIQISKFNENDIGYALEIWNEVVKEGVAFPQLDMLDKKGGIEFFLSQTFTGIAKDKKSGNIVGLYILHPNNVGRCSHIANTSYAVNSKFRGNGIGRKLVEHSLVKAKECGFKILQFNAVVASNTNALKLYRDLGFTKLGVIPNGFLLKDGSYEDIIPHYITL